MKILRRKARCKEFFGGMIWFIMTLVMKVCKHVYETRIELGILYVLKPLRGGGGNTLVFQTTAIRYIVQAEIFSRPLSEFGHVVIIN